MLVLLIFHILAIILTGFGLFYEYKYIKFPATRFQWHHDFGGKFKFLSVQNLFIQYWYFFFACVHDVSSTFWQNDRSKPLGVFIDNYFAGLLFPLSVFVSLNFWVLYTTKREKVFPKELSCSVPLWHLHILHTSTLLLALTEMSLRFHKFPEFWIGLATILSFTSTYIIWLCSIKIFAGFWVYPLLNNLTCKDLGKYFGNVLLQMVVIYMLCEILNNAVWNKSCT